MSIILLEIEVLLLLNTVCGWCVMLCKQHFTNFRERFLLPLTIWKLCGENIRHLNRYYTEINTLYTCNNSLFIEVLNTFSNWSDFLDHFRVSIRFWPKNWLMIKRANTWTHVGRLRLVQGILWHCKRVLQTILP